MEEFLNILEKLNPLMVALIGGFISFLITKYTYHRNVPLDKLEVAYNRVYYPLYNIIKVENMDLETVIEKITPYMRKYRKYIDRATIIAFDDLCRCGTSAKKKAAYQNFKNNIFDRNSKLRRRLGYLEPSILQLYKYSSASEKSTFRIIMEICVMYAFIIFGGGTQGKVQNFFLLIVVGFWIIILSELIWKFVKYVYYKIKK